MLEVLAHGIDLRIRNQRSVGVVKGPQFISFVRAAEATRRKQLKTTAGGILATSNDWQMRAGGLTSVPSAYSNHESTTRHNVVVTN